MNFNTLLNLKKEDIWVFLRVNNLGREDVARYINRKTSQLLREQTRLIRSFDDFSLKYGEEKAKDVRQYLKYMMDACAEINEKFEFKYEVKEVPVTLTGLRNMLDGIERE